MFVFFLFLKLVNVVVVIIIIFAIIIRNANYLWYLKKKYVILPFMQQ